MVACAAVAALASLLAIAWLHDDGDRGRARAVSTIAHVEAPPKPPVAPAPVAPPVAPATAAQAPASSGLPARADQEVEIENGVRVIRPRRDRGMTGFQPVPGTVVSVPRSAP